MKHKEEGSSAISITNNKRDSNIELLRVVMILTIMAHHSVVNSGIEFYDVSAFCPKLFAIQCFGFGGKIGIDVFLLITGYFMCTGTATYFKFVKLFFEY